MVTLIYNEGSFCDTACPLNQEIFYVENQCYYSNICQFLSFLDCRTKSDQVFISDRQN